MEANLQQVIDREKVVLQKNRAQRGVSADSQNLENTLFGVALSGGGIRAGVTGLGFLKALQDSGLLKHTDYLSSVSGGGLAAGHLLDNGEIKEELIQVMRGVSQPSGIDRIRHPLSVFTYYVTSLAFSWVNLAIVLAILYYVLILLPVNFFPIVGDSVLDHLTLILCMIFLLHFLCLSVIPSVSRFFIPIEIVLLTLLVSIHAYTLFLAFNPGNHKEVNDEAVRWEWFIKNQHFLINGLLLVVMGFFINPNRFLLYSYPNDFFARNFLIKRRNLLYQLNGDSKTENKNSLPYPLINATLALKNSDSNEHFDTTEGFGLYLMSPLYFGSKPTGYIRTEHYMDPRSTSLMDAIQISAAKMTMGVRPEGLFRLLAPLKVMSKFMGKIFNFNEYLYWMSNPSALTKSRAIVWWPVYYFKELFGKIDANGNLIAVSDGGNFDNLGVYALLQRKCKVILAMDCSYDPEYRFDDLRNLIVRAQNELGLAIIFRHDSTPEDVIAPRATNPYSDQRYAVADIIQLWEEAAEPDPDTGKVVKTKKRINRPIAVLLYTKAALTGDDLDPVAPNDASDLLEYGTYKYKLYNKAFPHQAGAIDRITNPVQWQCYYQLGQHMVNEVLANVQSEDSGITFEALEKAYQD